MGSQKTALKVLYLIFAVAVGVGWFYVFLFFLFSLDGFFGGGNVLDAIGAVSQKEL